MSLTNYECSIWAKKSSSFIVEINYNELWVKYLDF